MFNSLSIFLEHAVRLDIINGKLILENKIYIARNTTLKVRSGAILQIGKSTFIGENCFIAAHNRIDIGKDCLIADNVAIFDHDHNIQHVDKSINKQGYISKQIVIGDNVWIGSHVVICKGVTIGNGSVVGAGSVVTKDVPAMTVCAGVPARILRKRI
jgi:acetyltransferase-like isoleucine patch superfamily enzyme